MNTEHRRQRHRVTTKLWYRRRAAAFIAQGLTARGLPRKYQRHSLRIAIGKKHSRYMEASGIPRDRLRRKLYRHRNIAAGLRGDGKPRYSNLTPLEQQWRHERELMSVQVRTWDEVGSIQDRY